MKRLFAIGLSLLMLVEFSATVVASEFIWCATVENVEFIRASKCQSKEGQNFASDKSQAEAKHKRLKSAKSSTVGNSAIELVFWQTIQHSDDPDMFREYLIQFPKGCDKAGCCV